jgi:DNA-directed RNA polymerase specialized sigma subunit
MVRQYSKKTEIKEDDDLRSYVNQGLLDGIRKFDPKRGSKFIYFAHIWMKKNIFLGGVIHFL